jgi:uncharacterized membrane protein YidH (DUF202 family)
MDVSGFVDRLIVSVLNPLSWLLLGIAVLVFVAGVVRFLANSTNPEERSKGMRHMVWGMVGFLIMYSVNGILTIIDDSIDPLP